MHISTVQHESCRHNTNTDVLQQSSKQYRRTTSASLASEYEYCAPSRQGTSAETGAVTVPASAALDVEPRMNLATGEDPRGLGPREGDDPLGEDPRGGLLPLGRMLAVGRVLVTVASSAEGSGTAPRTKRIRHT